MIRVGIDAIAIERFSRWPTYERDRLERIFSTTEITYSLSNQLLARQRFAVRFAAKEAFFKAVSPLLEKPLPFLTLCKLCQMVKTEQGMPNLHIQWDALPIREAYHAQVTLTHTDTLACALVLIQKLD